MNTPVFSPSRLMPTAGKIPCIVCCMSAQDDWRWLPHELDEKSRQWHFCDDTPRNLLERLIQSPNLALIRACWQAVQLVKRNQADLLLTSQANITFWCAVLMKLQRVKVEHIALSFYLPKLPAGLGYWLAQWAYAAVNRFVVHSRAERQFYSESLGIAMGRFEMQHWSQPTLTAKPSKPLHPGEYVCVWSDPAHEHRSLLAAMAQLPDIPFALMLPHRPAIAFTTPSNVTIWAGLSTAQQMNLLQHSRFLVRPICQAYQPLDPTLLVAAMRLSKAFVIADLPNVSDYAFQHANAMLYQPANSKSLASAIRHLWMNVVDCEVLGKNGREFATSFCSKASARHYLRQLFIHYGL